MESYDVIIIGGGITGAGTARDCSMRGLKTLLLERFDFSVGATGRNHGLLHSGARYAVANTEGAAECMKENLILKRIARHCIEDHGGLFLSLPEDDLSYQKLFVESCRKAGIAVEVIDPKEALKLEGAANPNIIGAVKVPDASIDPFRLTTANVIDARRHGADYKTYTQVTELILSGVRVVGVKTINTKTGEKREYYGKTIVNAAGIWSHNIARLADIEIKMCPSKGTLLIFGHRINNVVLNRCRKASDADILVPNDTISILGTTSQHVSFDEIDNLRVNVEEVDLLLKEGTKLSPRVATTRIIRTYSGVRPLVANEIGSSGRDISRGYVCIDHKQRDGIEGFITITGGKLMTYRLMAESVTNMVCRKLGNYMPCQTAIKPLPGSENNVEEIDGLLTFRERAVKGRHGSMSNAIKKGDKFDNALVCECEQVSTAEIKYAIESLEATNLFDLRRRTRMGMGPCQGQLCSGRSAGLLSEYCGIQKDPLGNLGSFLNERWQGVFPIGWGDTLSKVELTTWLYNGVCGLDSYVHKENIPVDKRIL